MNTCQASPDAPHKRRLLGRFLHRRKATKKKAA
jgi:hypothetical protein